VLSGYFCIQRSRVKRVGRRIEERQNLSCLRRGTAQPMVGDTPLRYIYGHEMFNLRPYSSDEAEQVGFLIPLHPVPAGYCRMVCWKDIWNETSQPLPVIAAAVVRDFMVVHSFCFGNGDGLFRKMKIYADAHIYLLVSLF